MDLDFLIRVRRTSLLTSIVLFPVISVYFGWAVGAGWLVAGVWSVVNIHFTGVLMRAVVTYPKRSRTRIVLISLVKFPLLYAIGFLLLRSGMFSVPGAMAGFLWPLTVIVLKAAGRIVLGMDKSVEGAPTHR